MKYLVIVGLLVVGFYAGKAQVDLPAEDTLRSDLKVTDPATSNSKDSFDPEIIVVKGDTFIVTNRDTIPITKLKRTKEGVSKDKWDKYHSFRSKYIDPRNFVVLFEEKNRVYSKNNSTHDNNTLQENNSNFGTPFIRLWDPKSSRRSKYIDYDSKVIIDFDWLKLSEVTEFKGKLSLSAEVNGQPIEVNPYAQVGSEYQEIGISSELSASEFSKAFVEFSQSVYKLKEISSSLRYMLDSTWRYVPTGEYSYLLDSDGNIEDSIEMNEFKLLSRLEVLDYGSLQQLTLIFNEFNNELKLAAEYASYFSSKKHGESPLEILAQTSNISRIQLQELLTQVKKLHSSTSEIQIIDFDPDIGEDSLHAPFRRLYQNFHGSIEPAISFLDDSHEKLTDILKKMIVDYFKKHYPEINGIHFDHVIVPTGDELINGNLKYPTRRELGLPIQSSLEYWDDDWGWEGYYLDEDLVDSSEEKAEPISVWEFLSIEKIRKYIIDEIALRTSQVIFSQLQPAIIDLRQANVNEGDVLRVFVVREEVSKTDSLQTDKIPYLIDCFVVRKLGWRNIDFKDNFFLINQIASDPLDPASSSSRFSGSYGASVMISYRSDKTGVNYRELTPYKERGKSIYNLDYGLSKNRYDVNLDEKKSAWLKFVRSLQPSFGFNVSYLDFDDNLPVEIGLGGVVGLFNNSIHMTSGYNLNVSDNNWYVGIGVSILDLREKFETTGGTP